jgi:acyl-CoA synthetase (AMP-forming)/AMP-acid ligase II
VSSPTLADLLVNHPATGAEPLLHSRDETLTADAARREAQIFAERLREAGVERSQGVALRMVNDPHAITAMFGVWLAGAVFVPLNARAPETEAEQILEHTRPAVLCTNGEFLRRSAPAQFDPEIAFVTSTSGTTGRPKPVQHTHTGYLELLDRVIGPLRGQAHEHVRRPAPNLVPVSLALNAGIYNVLFGLRAGAEIVIMNRFEPSEFADLVARFGIRSTVLPPAALVMLSDDSSISDLAPLRFVRSITAPLSPLQARRFSDRFGVTVLNGYGQAEIGEVIGWTAADARDYPEKIGAVGRPHPGVHVRLVDRDSDTGIGRLFVRPPSTAAGLDRGRLDADGYVDTGDLARIDDDRFVWVEGRAGDVINRGGNKVFPEQVEEVLRLSAQVRDAAVVGAPDERLGEVPVAFVVADAEVADRDLFELCRQHLVPYKIPVAIHRVDALPRTDVGKVRRQELLDRLR